MFSLSAFDYYLPEKYIAQKPLSKRDESKLLILNKATGRIFFDFFYNLNQYLDEGDLLVLNNTKVVPVRIYGHKKSGARIETFLIKHIVPGLWEVMLKPASKLKLGETLFYKHNLSADLVEVMPNGNRLLRFSHDKLYDYCEQEGEMPLPPYVKSNLSLQEQREKYQTVFAEKEGALAAPTAGLHFTEELFNKLSLYGIERSYLTLHVGLGTFKPITIENFKEHKMHKESYVLTADTVKKIATVKKNQKKVVAVGTTSVRVLESIYRNHGRLEAEESETDIFIYPGFNFRVTDAIITNFHLPKSTLLLLVSAFAGKDLVLEAYQKAIENNFRFYSFGDAMLIV